MLNYKHANNALHRSNSFILDNNNNTYTFITKPEAGFSADNRFFGKGNEKKFLVKRPKYYTKFGPFNEQEIKKIDVGQKSSYEQEQNVWNKIYPNHQASLFTEGGLRLVLPCLPGDTLSVCISDDKLTRCQQLLSIAYAIKEFNNHGFTYNDFNLDNVLVEKISEGVFRAYLIDFNDILDFKNRFGAIHELCMIAHLIPDKDWELNFGSSDELIEFLKDKISILNAQADQVKSACNF